MYKSLLPGKSVAAARSARRFHLLQARALDLFESKGLPVGRYEVVQSSSALDSIFQKPEYASGAILRAQVADAGGFADLQNGSFGSLNGIAHSASRYALLLAADLIVLTILLVPRMLKR